MLDLGSASASAKFDKEDTDSLDNWSKRRAALMASANISAAHSLLDSGTYGNYGSYGSYGSLYGGCINSWGFNPWYGMMTYIPCSGTLMSPYGYRYWSPYTVTRAYYVPPAGGYYNGGGGMGGIMPSYPTMGQTSSGYSGAVASAPAMSSPSTASASSSASAAASSSVGHGSASGGGHGK
jgi:hypothetical protein